MNKNLSALAQKMQVLKMEDKENFLIKMENCAILFDLKNPRSIPLCSVDERMGYKIDLIRSLYRKLEGERWTQPTSLGRALASAKELKQMNEQELRQRIISDGIWAYCNAPTSDRVNFEKIVRREKLFAPFLRKKDKILDYDFM